MTIEVSQSMDSIVVDLNSFDYNIAIRKDCAGGVFIKAWKYCFYGKNSKTEVLGFLRRF